MNGRTKFVVGWMALLFVIAWTMSLGRLLGSHFWDRRYVIEQQLSESEETTIADNPASYYSDRRYIFFLPHVFGAVFWWNLYFLQLFPGIRHNYKWFHRNLGRFLMLTALCQVISGVGLACTSNSPIVKLVSIALAIAVSYCLFSALYYAIHRDIPKHKFWVLRLVGYMQTIALQRFWLFVLMLTDSHFLDSSGKDDVTPEEKFYQMFDQSFVLGILSAMLVTEWYLSAELLGMSESPKRTTPKIPETAADIQSEKRPLL